MFGAIMVANNVTTVATCQCTLTRVLKSFLYHSVTLSMTKYINVIARDSSTQTLLVP